MLQFRWESALSNYRTARQHGGQFILLVHDLWGADSLQPADAPFPGDNGDWAFYDEFFSALVQNMKQADMIEGVVIDIWNEPDGANFWNRPQDQYLQMWGRASEKFRSEFPDIPLSGPSASYAPYPTDTWWDAWASYVVSNQSLPDQHHWHSLRKTETSDQMLRNYDNLLAKYGATRGEGLVNINEYGSPEEQTAAGSAWWIAQLERANIFGCRANWASAYALHDFMGQLLGKPGAGTDSYNATGTGYWANAEYQVYKYYASTMTGDRVRTETTEDTNGDVYVTVDDDGMIRILAGARAVTGSWNVHLEGLSELGLPSSGALEVHAYKFPGTSDPYARLDAPTDLGVLEYNYTDDSLSFPIAQTDVYTAWAFEIEF
ncbi:glycoside hydrolase superfamily [Aspergillus lucknowensis]|uniref:Glycoside hydrolase superfamily n=1 Tax=Aspergillus lucknowensis TaxID=176173 RepID=A0ABR4M4A8_9EURO